MRTLMPFEMLEAAESFSAACDGAGVQLARVGRCTVTSDRALLIRSWCTSGPL